MRCSFLRSTVFALLVLSSSSHSQTIKQAKLPLSVKSVSQENDSTERKEIVLWDEEPKPIKTVAPIYLQSALRDSIQGRVFVDLTINEEGNVEAAVVRQSVRPDLDSAAVKATKQWKFAPTMLGGKPIKVTINQCLTFKLKKAVR